MCTEIVTMRGASSHGSRSYGCSDGFVICSDLWACNSFWNVAERVGF
jgi:hypothetical protein